MEKEIIDRKKLANKSIPLVEKGNFCRYFATMIRSGTPILEAVESIAEETHHKTFHQMLLVVKDDLQKGKTLTDSLSQFPKAFDPIFLTVVKAGEESGTLDNSLEYLGKQIIADYHLLQKVKGALLYPLIILVTMSVMGFIMFTVVLPRIAKVFLASGLPIPGATRFIFEASLIFEKYMFIILAALIGFTFLLFYFFTRGSGKKMIRAILPKLPVVKRLFSDLDVARFARILGTLLQSGVPIVSALKIATDSLTLPQYTKLGPTLTAEISKGASIKDVLHKQGSAFPRMFTAMIAIGEETGTLEKILFDVAAFYDEEVDGSLKNFTTVLEPILMVIVGIVVAVMVLSIITPIYSLVGSLNVQ